MEGKLVAEGGRGDLMTVPKGEKVDWVRGVGWMVRVGVGIGVGIAPDFRLNDPRIVLLSHQHPAKYHMTLVGK